MEYNEGQSGKNNSSDQRGERRTLANRGLLVSSALLFLIGFKFLDEVVKWGRYSSAVFLMLAVTFIGAAICTFFYGFLDFSFP